MWNNLLTCSYCTQFQIPIMSVPAMISCTTGIASGSSIPKIKMLVATSFFPAAPHSPSSRQSSRRKSGLAEISLFPVRAQAGLVFGMDFRKQFRKVMFRIIICAREVCGYTMYSFLRDWWWPWKGLTHARRFDKFVLIVFRIRVIIIQLHIGQLYEY